MIRILVGIIFFGLCVPTQSWARPEYAARYNIVQCTACHLSPTGGGPRNTYGKLFGAHGYKINPRLAQDYFGADFRALFYYPEEPSPSKDGAGIMSGSVSGHASLDEDDRIQLTIEHNVGGFSAAPYRDTYALLHLHKKARQPKWFDTVLIGRYRIPFGIVTDEHRTYTRLQTHTEWYAMDTGAMLSGQPDENSHYDLALTNGDRQSGANLNNGNAVRFGGVFNFRYMSGPVMWGTSLSKYDRRLGAREAISLYALVSLSRWTDERIPLSIKIENVRAKNFNENLARGFAADNVYVTSISQAQSSGWLAWLEYSLNPRWVLIYKYDLLTPDRDFPADIYDRHGLGLRWYFGPNALIQARTEFARATHPTETRRTSEGAQNATFAILQLSL